MPQPSGPIVAEQHGVRVDLLEDLEVARRLDLEDGLRARAEPLDLLARVRRREPSADSQSSSRRRMNAVRMASVVAALLDDDGLNLKRRWMSKILSPVLEAEEPLPPALVEEQLTERLRTMDRCRSPDGTIEAQPAAVAEQRVTPARGTACRG